MTLHQFVPTWEPGAIGSHVLALHEMLVARGVDARVWASEIKPGLTAVAHDATEFFARRAAPLDGSADRRDVLLYHCAVGAELGEMVMARPEPLIVNHHNVTPPHYFDSWMPALAENLEVGEAQVGRLARRATLGIADSAFNAEGLLAGGCSNVVVVPVFVDVARLGPRAQRSATTARSRSDAVATGTRWLFVGRIAPNKAVHELVRAFAWYRAAYEPAAHLTIIGSVPADRYAAAIERLAARLGVDQAITFAGMCSDAELGAHYSDADVYVSCSDHEGFGVPIIEAMHMGLPVVALAAGAVAQTAGAAAILLHRRDPGLMASAVHRLAADKNLRAGVVSAGSQRAQDFSFDVVGEQWFAALEPWVTT